jgi:hypothetical protein
MIIKIIEGKGVFLDMNTVDISEEVKVSVEGDHDTFVGSSQEYAIKQRRRQTRTDDVKVIGTTDKMQARNQGCLSKQTT